jgi:hypothetical protein
MQYKISLDNYLPIDHLPKECRFISLIKSMRGKYQVHLEIHRATKLSPYSELVDIIGNGDTPNKAWLEALNVAKRKAA